MTTAKSVRTNRPKKDFPALAAEIRVLFSVLIKYARRDLEKRLAKTGAGVSPLGFGVLHLLAHKEMTVKGLSERMTLAPATLIPVVDSLEKHRYLKRQEDKNDRRRNLLILTPSGRKIAGIIALDGDFLTVNLVKLGFEKSLRIYDLVFELVDAVVGPEKLKSILDKADAHHNFNK